MKTPVIFMVFNRPDLANQVLKQIARFKPRQLGVISDGPRPDQPNDRQRVDEVRRLIENRIDWPCDLHLDYAESNLGCGRRIATGLDAAFDRYDRAIVLEDDTLPDPSFFTFCETMLDRYAHDEQVVHISGTNAAAGLGKIESSDTYSFSTFPDIWGWASWSRSWKHYDRGIGDWDSSPESKKWLRTISPHARICRSWGRVFDNQKRLGENPRTWDTSWVYSCARRGLSVTPGRNLISNRGFGIDSTNCLDALHPLVGLPTSSIAIDLPAEVTKEADHSLDDLLQRYRFGGEELLRKKSFIGRLQSSRVTRSLKQLLSK